MWSSLLCSSWSEPSVFSITCEVPSDRGLEERRGGNLWLTDSFSSAVPAGWVHVAVRAGTDRSSPRLEGSQPLHSVLPALPGRPEAPKDFLAFGLDSRLTERLMLWQAANLLFQQQLGALEHFRRKVSSNLCKTPCPQHHPRRCLGEPEWPSLPYLSTPR